jgi:hypothetical protein
MPGRPAFYKKRSFRVFRKEFLVFTIDGRELMEEFIALRSGTVVYRIRGIPVGTRIVLRVYTP